MLRTVYFGYISLWEGFVIVGLIDVGAPGWVVGGVAIALLIVGRAMLGSYKRRLMAERASTQMHAGAI
jgi:hypothetical protein